MEALTKTEEVEKMEEVMKTEEEKKPEEVEKTEEVMKTEKDKKPEEFKKMEEVMKTVEEKKPEEVEKIEEVMKTVEEKKPEEVEKMEEVIKTVEEKKPEEVEKMEEVMKTVEDKKPEEVEKTADGQKTEEKVMKKCKVDGTAADVDEANPKPKNVGQVVSKIKNRARRHCGIIFMENPLSDEEGNVPSPEKKNDPDFKPEEKVSMGKLKKQNENPGPSVKRGRGRPRLSEQKSPPKPKAKKRIWSSSSSDSESEKLKVVPKKEPGPQNSSGIPIRRPSSTGPPTKMLRGTSANEDSCLSLIEMLTRQFITRTEVVQGILPGVKSSTSPPFSKRKYNKIPKKEEPKEAVSTVAPVPAGTGIQIPFLLLPSALSFTDRFFIQYKRCFLARNYYKVRTFVKTLNRTSIRKLKPRTVGSVLKSRARLEGIVSRIQKKITACYRVSVQPAEPDESELRYAMDQGLFLRRNFTKVRENCSISSLESTKKVVKKRNEGKGPELVAEYLKKNSVGYVQWQKGSNERPLALALREFF